MKNFRIKFRYIIHIGKNIPLFSPPQTYKWHIELDTIGHLKQFGSTLKATIKGSYIRNLSNFPGVQSFPPPGPGTYSLSSLYSQSAGARKRMWGMGRNCAAVIMTLDGTTEISLEWYLGDNIYTAWVEDLPLGEKWGETTRTREKGEEEDGKSVGAYKEEMDEEKEEGIYRGDY